MRSLVYRLLAFGRSIAWFITRPVIVGVRVFLVQEGQVLLVRHSYEDLWFLPGGGAKRGETLEQAARREAHEEVGAEIQDMRLFGMYTNLKEYKTDHIAVFEAIGFTTSTAARGEIAEIRWFPLGNLPANLSPGQRRRIEEYRSDAHPPTSAAW